MQLIFDYYDFIFKVALFVPTFPLKMKFSYKFLGVFELYDILSISKFIYLGEGSSSLFSTSDYGEWHSFFGDGRCCRQEIFWGGRSWFLISIYRYYYEEL